MNGCTGHCPHCGIELGGASDVPCDQCVGKRRELIELAKHLPLDRLEDACRLLMTLRDRNSPTDYNSEGLYNLPHG